MFRKVFLLGVVTMVAWSPLAYGGAVPKPIGGQGRAEAFSTLTYKMTFEGGEVARIAVLGDGDTDLDLYVYDEDGDLVAKDDDFTDKCFVSWTPRRTSAFTVKVVNRGGVYNNFNLLTN